MKNRLEEQMKEMLEDASLKDVLPDFDKEALWSELQPKINSRKKIYVLPAARWALRAAAILLIAVIAYRFLYTPNHQPQMIQVATTVKKTEKNTVAAGHPKPAISIHEPAQQQTNKMIEPAQKAKAVAAVPKQKESLHPIEDVVIPAPIITPKQVVPVPAAIAKAIPKVTHYLDLDEEEQPAVAATPHPLIQMKLNKPGIPDDAVHQKPVRDLAFALDR